MCGEVVAAHLCYSDPYKIVLCFVPPDVSGGRPPVPQIDHVGNVNLLGRRAPRSRMVLEPETSQVRISSCRAQVALAHGALDHFSARAAYTAGGSCTYTT